MRIEEVFADIDGEIAHAFEPPTGSKLDTSGPSADAIVVPVR